MRRRSNQLCGALCFAAASLVVLPGWARNTAGPDVPRKTPTPSVPVKDASPAPPVAPTQPSAAASAPKSDPAAATPAAATPAAATPAAATPAPPVTPPADAERAKQYYQLGAEAFAAQRNADAIRYFGLAAQIVPSAKLRYNIALAYDEMGDTGRALAEYRAYLRQEAGAEQLEDVRRRVRELEARLAVLGVQQLSVLSSPAGATVRVDDHILGVTPWSGELVPGRHRVTLELARHEGRSTEIELPAEQATELRLELSEEPVRPPEESAPSAWRRITPLAWTFLGVGAGAISGGIAFELSRASSSERAGRASSTTDAAEAQGAADAKQMASLTLLGFGSAFLIGGGILTVLDLRADAADRGDADAAEKRGVTARIGLPCVPGFCGVTAQGRF